VRSLTAYRPATLVVTLLAALTTWVTLLAWADFAENPAGFLLPVLGACLLVAVAGMVLRSARVPAVLVALAQVLLVLVWLQHRLAAGAALGGLIPTPGSVRAMVTALHDSGVAAQTYSAPVPASVPEFYPLLILTGSLTAILVDLLAVGLRRAPLAGLPLLAAYTAPVSILSGGVSWLTFAASALCFLFLIAADEAGRLSHWGEQLTPGGGLFEPRSSMGGGQAIWSSARKIGFTATALAVVVPLFVPTFTASFFGGGGGNGAGNGDAVSIANPMVDLKRDLVRGADVDLLQVTTTDPDPSYLRIAVLNSFDGNAWRPAGRDIPTKQRADGPVPRPQGLGADVASTQFRSIIKIGDNFRSRWLPTPYPVAAVDAPGDWRYDTSTLDFISAADGQTTAGLSYTLRSLQVSPTATQLAQATPAPPSIFTPETALPRNFPGAVRRLATTVTAGRTTPFEQAVALQQWFREDGGFRYSLKRSSGNGTSDLLAFLSTGKNGRVGYCEQFAAAMAVMGRTLGIPSRVAVGFLHPEKTRSDTWVYSSHDLHSWPEMYFGGVGWVRFEPTPQDRTGDIPAYTAQQVPSAAPSSSNAAPSAAPPVNRVDKSTNAKTPTGSTAKGSTPSLAALLLTLLGLVVLVLLLLAPRALRALLRRRVWADAHDADAWVEAGWSELRDTALDLGVTWRDHVTLRSSALSLEQCFGRRGGPDDALGRASHRGPDADPDATAALHRLVALLERARYARFLPAGATTLERVRADVEACAEALRAGSGPRRRRRAAWFPVSLLTSVRTRRRTAVRRGRMLGEPGVDRAV
jgi:transglutaminase-like putative cysteine protease